MNLSTKLSRVSYWRKLIYTIIIGIAIVWFWRGVWQLTDLYLFHNNYVLSNVVCLILAIIVLVITQKALKKLI